MPGMGTAGRHWQALALALAAIACSGRYTKNGPGEEPETSPSQGGGAIYGNSPGGALVTPAVGGNPGAGAGGSGVGASTTTGATSNEGPPPVLDGLDPECLQLGLPEDELSELAAPGLVWRRLSPFIWGEHKEPLDSLPTATTAIWLDEMISQTFEHVRGSTGGTLPGAAWFVRQWLGLNYDAPLQGDYAGWLAREASLVPTLVARPLNERHRFGVFSEPSWLTAYQGISARGTALSGALLQEIPPAPPNIPRELEPTLPERQALANAVANPACMACHMLMDPIGVALLHFDELGGYRETEKGQPIDASGEYRLESAELLEFSDHETLATQLAKTCDATRGLSNAFLRVGIAQNRISITYEDLQRAQTTMRQKLYDFGLSYEGWVKAFARTRVVLAP